MHNVSQWPNERYLGEPLGELKTCWKQLVLRRQRKVRIEEESLHEARPSWPEIKKIVIPSLFLRDAEYRFEAWQLLPFLYPDSAAEFRATLALSSNPFPAPTFTHDTNI